MGDLGKIRSDLGRKQPKTCVWVSAVEGKAFLQRSRMDLFFDFYPHPQAIFRGY